MKKLLIAAIAFTVTAACLAGEFSYVTMTVTPDANGATNASVRVDGTIHGIYLDITATGTAGTQAVSVVTSGNTMASQTLLSVALFAADAWYYPEAATHLNTAGTANSGRFRKLKVVQDTLELRSTLVDTNPVQTVSATVVVEGAD